MPSPYPSPRGEGIAFPCDGKSHLTGESSWSARPLLLLPGGEGWGEGEPISNPRPFLRGSPHGWVGFIESQFACRSTLIVRSGKRWALQDRPVTRQTGEGVSLSVGRGPG